MTKLFMSTAAVLMLAAPAFAGETKCNASDQASWISQTDLTAMYAGKGYEVKNIKIESGCYEIYALDTNGKRVEMYVDPITGEQAAEQSDDDSYSDSDSNDDSNDDSDS